MILLQVDSLQMLNELHERGHLPSSSPDDDISIEKENAESSFHQNKPLGKFVYCLIKLGEYFAQY